MTKLLAKGQRENEDLHARLDSSEQQLAKSQEDKFRAEQEKYGTIMQLAQCEMEKNRLQRELENLKVICNRETKQVDSRASTATLRPTRSSTTAQNEMKIRDVEIEILSDKRIVFDR